MRFLHPLFLTLSKFPDGFANLYDGFIFTHQILTIIFWVLRSRSHNLMLSAMAYSGRDGKIQAQGPGPTIFSPTNQTFSKGSQCCYNFQSIGQHLIFFEIFRNRS